MSFLALKSKSKVYFLNDAKSTEAIIFLDVCLKAVVVDCVQNDWACSILDCMHFLFKQHPTLGLVDIFKSGRQWSHMRDFIYIKCCGFFSEISILDDKWLLNIAKK